VNAKTVTVTFAVLTLIVPLIYIPGVFDFVRHPRLFVIQIGLLLCCGYCFARSKPLPLPNKTLLALGAWGTWSLLSSFWATNQVEAMIRAQSLIVFAIIPVILYTISQHVSFKRIYAVASFAGAIVSMIGICQYFGWAFSTIPTVGNPSATFGYRNFAASYLVVLLPCTIAFALSEQKKIQQWGWISSATLMALFLIYTRTRGAWMGMLIAGLITTAFLLYIYSRSKIQQAIITKKRLLLFAIMTLVVCVVGLIPAQMTQTGKFKFDEKKTDAVTTLTTAFSPSDARGRLTVWQHTLKMIIAHPIQGVGLGSWQYEYPKYDKGDWITDNAAPQRPHNDLLWILAETGVIGFGLYIWFLFTIAQAIWHKARLATDESHIWVVGIGTGLLAFIGHSCFSFPLERPGPSLIFWIGVGSIIALTKPSSNTTQSFRSFYGLAIPCLVAGLFLSYRLIQFDIFYLQAQGAWRTQSWSQILSATQNALQWGPINYRAYLLQGAAHQQLGHPERAITSYQLAQKYHPNEGHGPLGNAYLTTQKYDQALKHLQIEHQLYPNASQPKADLANALIITGASFQKQGAYSQAKTHYEQALQLTPEDPRIYNNLGSLFMAQSQFPLAENAFLEALNINANYAHVYHNLGDLFTLQKDTLRALQAYETFIQKWQGNPQMQDLARAKQKRLSP